MEGRGKKTFKISNFTRETYPPPGDIRCPGYTVDPRIAFPELITHPYNLLVENREEKVKKKNRERENRATKRLGNERQERGGWCYANVRTAMVHT